MPITTRPGLKGNFTFTVGTISEKRFEEALEAERLAHSIAILNVETRADANHKESE